MIARATVPTAKPVAYMKKGVGCVSARPSRSPLFSSPQRSGGAPWAGKQREVSLGCDVDDLATEGSAVGDGEWEL